MASSNDTPSTFTIRDLIYYHPRSGLDPLHKLDLYLPQATTTPPPLVVFVHGGVWRSGDKSQHAQLGQTLSAKYGLAVACINYRLSTLEKAVPDAPAGTPLASRCYHPTHVLDTARAVAFLMTHGHLLGFDPKRIVLSGHSAGAHLISLLALQPDLYLNPALDETYQFDRSDTTPATNTNTNTDTKTKNETETEAPSTTSPSTTPYLDYYQCIRGVLGAAGLYHLPLFIETYPPYVEFMRQAFGTADPAVLSQASPQLVKPSASVSSVATSSTTTRTRLPWCIAHSVGDALVDLPQSAGFADHLARCGYPESRKFDLTGGHDDMLTTPDFLATVADFTQRVAVL
ncbi:hypothetical protein H4R33_002562 [Dimargaris cristalligena]|nr:hypothetical protein H4R33_002562 [Dimargaris cristalligena]